MQFPQYTMLILLQPEDEAISGSLAMDQASGMLVDKLSSELPEFLKVPKIADRVLGVMF